MSREEVATAVRNLELGFWCLFFVRGLSEQVGLQSGERN